MRLTVIITVLFSILEWSKGKQGEVLDRVKRSYYPMCPIGCATCSGINGCVTCRPKLFLLLHREGVRHKGICVHGCPNGYYGFKKKEYSRCSKCSIPNCESCFSRSYCTRCTAPYLAHRGKCIEKCPADLYYAQNNRECQKKVDCSMAQWGLWGPCVRNSQTCGYKYGIESRSREVLQVPSPNGHKCLSTTESRRCRMKFRHCVDLLHNSSDPLRGPLPNKRKRRRNKDGRRKRRGRDQKRRKHERKNHKNKRRKRKRGRMRNTVELPDVSTNRLSALMIPRKLDI